MKPSDSFYKSISQAMSLTVIFGATFALIGWWLDIPLLKSISPVWVSMKVNTALGFIFAGLSLNLLQKEKNKVGEIFAVMTLLIGLLTLSEYIFKLNLGIDQLFFQEAPNSIATSQPGRMSPMAAFNFILIGSSLFLLKRKNPSRYWASQSLVLTAALIALPPFFGYLYGVETPLLGLSFYTRMAFHTSLCFLFLCAGILFAHPDQGLMAVVSSDHLGGHMARRMIPLVILFIFFLGWFRLKGQEAGFYGIEFGTALGAIIATGVLVFLVWWNARSLNRADAGRERVATQLKNKVQEMEKATQDLKDSQRITLSLLEDMDETHRQLVKAKEELQKLNLTLEQRVEERTRELEAAQEKLVHNEKLAALGKLVRRVAHEIRNPLSALVSSVYFLKLCEKEIPNEDIKKHLLLIGKQAGTIEQFISNILEFARIKEPQKEENSLSQLIQGAVEKFPPPPSVRLSVSTLKKEDKVVVDPFQIEQVFGNLMSNAYQAMPKGGALKIEVEKNQQGDFKILFEDTGGGIPPENLTKIFEPLFSTKPKGTGLGLAICQQIVEKHGGSLEVRSTLGKGSQFIVKLPRGA